MYLHVSFKLNPFSFLTFATNVLHSVVFLPKPYNKGAACAAILAPDDTTAPTVLITSFRSRPLILLTRTFRGFPAAVIPLAANAFSVIG